MNAIQLDEEAIFCVARKLEDREARAAYLRQVCGTNHALQDRVEALLGVSEQEASFLEVSPFDATVDISAPTEGPGTTIGPYRLMEVIGEGGMGTVYLAEQHEPVRRKVALKVIKPGMDSKQVIARFEAERQALAMMDHPNIARVLDGGTTPPSSPPWQGGRGGFASPVTTPPGSPPWQGGAADRIASPPCEGGAGGGGRPYFVMELVRGVPITEYCDHQQLTIPERLELFVLVCRAVQYAHQKGIIHRDIKPSNVLVTEIDGAAVPKVIDFGVAKAIGDPLTGHTCLTAFHQFLGTPLYMSPEQAEFSGVDVDTRSDIYSLGVLLYELLTGTTPFDAETLRQAAFDEMQRILREDEPPRPSTRLSSLGETLSTVSARRKADPWQLDRSVRGELDWIVMKALEKDRDRRYDTANNFAADVLNYLIDRPVEACPPSGWYQLRKYVCRNRGTLLTLSLVALSLLAGLSMTTWQAFRATRAEKRMAEALGQAEDHLTLARRAVDQLYDEVADRWSFNPLYSPLPREFLLRALPLYQRFSEQGPFGIDQGRAYHRVAKILLQLERYQEGIAALDKAIAIFERLEASDPANLSHRFDLALCFSLKHDLTQDDGIQAAVDLLEGLVLNNPGTPLYRVELARNLNKRGFERWSIKDPRARADLERALEIQEQLCTEKPDDPVCRYRLGATIRNLGLVACDIFDDLELAHDHFRQALAIHEELAARYPTRPQFHLELAWSDWAMSKTMVLMQRFEESLPYSEHARAIFRGLIEESPNTLWYRRLYSWALADNAEAHFQGGCPEAARDAIQEIERTVGYPYAYRQVWGIGMELVYCARPEFQKPAEAIQLAEQLLERAPDNFLALHLLGLALYRLGDFDGSLRVLNRLYSLQGDDALPATGFFLAMAHHSKGETEQARSWYDRSIAAMKPPARPDRYVKLYCAEAATLLGLDPPGDNFREETPLPRPPN